MEKPLNAARVGKNSWLAELSIPRGQLSSDSREIGNFAKDAALQLLDREELLWLRGLVDDRLAELEEEEEQADLSSSEPVSKPSRKKNGSGWLELKYINKWGPYVYKRWREGKILHSEYVGKVEKAQQAGS